MAEVTFLQTADATRYYRMLQATSETVMAFCGRHGHKYESFVGIKRGFHPWQACYNRVFLLQEKLGYNYRGWVAYVDADGFVADLTFDLAPFLEKHATKLFIFAGPKARPAIVEDWDEINDGVFFVNLAHPLANLIIGEWLKKIRAVPDEVLKKSAIWPPALGDQAMLRQTLREHPECVSEIDIVSHEFMNSGRATFIKQVLRSSFPSFEARVASIQEAVDQVLNRNADDRPQDAVSQAPRTRFDRNKLSEAGVVWAYRVLFDRDPESEQVVRIHADRFPTLRRLAEVLMKSSEYRKKWPSDSIVPAPPQSHGKNPAA